jgi:hypothetical protein
MQAEALDATDAALLIHQPYLPPTSSHATILAATVDKDVDVGAVGAMDHPYLMRAVHPPSCLS